MQQLCRPFAASVASVAFEIPRPPANFNVPVVLDVDVVVPETEIVLPV